MRQRNRAEACDQIHVMCAAQSVIIEPVTRADHAMVVLWGCMVVEKCVAVASVKQMAMCCCRSSRECIHKR